MNDCLIRTHADGVNHSEAVYSPCEDYRYSLTRTWSPSGRKLLFVMLNPSTADELRNDPTVERCERRARQMGFGAMRVVNIFAFRATRPQDLRKAARPEGPLNDAYLLESAQWADQILCAWGAHGEHLGQGPKIAKKLHKAGHDLCHIGLTKDGHPRHPLYVSYEVTPMLWDALR
jgi:hypothetical protein